MLRIIFVILCLQFCLPCIAQDSLPVTDGYVLMPDQSQKVMPSWMKNLYQQYGTPYFNVETNAGHFGIVDKNLKLVCDTIFRNFCTGMDYRTGKKDKFFYFRQLAVPGKSMHDFEGGWIMTNEKGKPINKLKFYKPWNFMNHYEFSYRGTWVADDNGKWGYLNSKFEWEVQPRFDSMWSFQWDTLQDRSSFVVKENGLFGILDSGKIIVPCKYNQVMYSFGGYFLVMRSESDTIVYEAETKKIYRFHPDGSFKDWPAYGTCFPVSGYLNVGKPISDGYAVKLDRSRRLLSTLAYKQRFEHGGVFSPALYDPAGSYESDRDWWRWDESNYCYPHYFPSKPYLPWFTFLSAYYDSSYFSYVSSYTMIDSYYYGYSQPEFPCYDASGICFFTMRNEDTVTYANYRVTADSCYPLDFFSLFRKDVDVRKTLLDILSAQAERSHKVIPEIDWKMSGKYFIDGYGLVVLFQSSEKDKDGNPQMMSFGYGWKTIEAYLDPDGPLSAHAVKLK